MAMRWSASRCRFPAHASGHVYLHSHMLAVRKDHRNGGLGRRLKLMQREDALARGIELIEWTFDPLEIKNAYLNIEKLGAIARRYNINQYGITSSPLQGGLPSDRLIAEWWLKSKRVETLLGTGKNPPIQSDSEIAVPAQIYEWKAAPEDSRPSAAGAGAQSRAISAVPSPTDWPCWATSGTRKETANSCWADGMKSGRTHRKAVIFTTEARSHREILMSLLAARLRASVVKDSVIQTMKIEAITLREIQMPLVHFFETSFGRLYSRRILLVTVHSEGVDGWGESVVGRRSLLQQRMDRERMADDDAIS